MELMNLSRPKKKNKTSTFSTIGTSYGVSGCFVIRQRPLSFHMIVLWEAELKPKLSWEVGTNPTK